MMKVCSALLLLLLLSLGRNGCLSNGASVQNPVKTVVILVMENRSFDHMFGWLKRLNPEIDGLTGTESNPINASDPNSRCIFVNDGAEFVDPDPGHSFEAIREQVFGGPDASAVRMNGFVQQARKMKYGADFPERVMSAFRPEVVPVTTALALEFALFDRWFASAPTSTQPNRLFVHSATSHGLVSNVVANLTVGFPQKTIFQAVEEAGLGWGVYYQNIPATLFYKELRKPARLAKFKEYSPSFGADARAGKLPNYVVVEARYFDVEGSPANDDHPSHDVAEGQKLIKEVYETLRASPQWNETLLLVTYDEHGGFFDHVPTPVSGVPSPDGIRAPLPNGFAFDRLGVRVPTLAISPWINKGVVVHEPRGPTPSSQFEHSSISATVKHIFNLSSFLTRRDAWAGSFHELLTQRAEPRLDCPKELPNPPWSLRHSPPDENRELTQFQQELVLLASHVTGEQEEVGAGMTVAQGHDYVTKAVSQLRQQAQRLASQQA